MKIPVIKRISKEDLRGDKLPNWVDSLLNSLNEFIVTTVTALSGRLTFEDNIQAKVLTYELVHDTELVINPQRGRLRVIGCLPSYYGDAVGTGFGWSPKSDGKIGITCRFGDSGTHKVKIIVLFGA